MLRTTYITPPIDKVIGHKHYVSAKKHSTQG